MPTLLLVARLALTRAGFEVITAQNDEEASTAAVTHRPDEILLDWMIPGLEGPSACALALCALGYIVKLFDALTLGDRVRQLLEAAS